MTPGRHCTEGTAGVGDGCGGSVRGADAGAGAGDTSSVGGAPVAEAAGTLEAAGDALAIEWVLDPHDITSATATSASALMPV